MLFVDRPDGRRVRGLKAFQAVMPYLLRGRNESAVYFEKDFDVENAIRYVHAKNVASNSTRFSLFGVFLAAALRTVAEKPDLNRFVHRRGIYAREEIAFSFVVKKRLAEEAEETNAKIRFDPSDTIDEAMGRIDTAIAFAKSEVEGADDREVRIAHSIPGGKACVTGLFRLLDRFNIAPAWMIKNDPLFSTAYFANLGSLGLDAPYHHLYEWGTASIFVVIGRMFTKEGSRGESQTGRRHFINIKVTVDERISEGIYFAHAASLFQRLVQKPELLEVRPGSL